MKLIYAGLYVSLNGGLTHFYETAAFTFILINNGLKHPWLHWSFCCGRLLYIK